MLARGRHRYTQVLPLAYLLVRSPIYFDPRWSGEHGIGRFSAELEKRLPNLQPLNIIGPKLSPIDPIASSLAVARKRDGCYFSPGFNPPLFSPIPVAFTIHDLIHLKIAAESTPLRRLYYATVVRPAARRAWRVLTVSEYSRRDIVEWAGISESSVFVVGNGVSPVFSPDQRVTSRTPYLLHVGRRAGHKNIDGLLAAFATSRTVQTNIRLMFTGAPDKPTLARAEILGITNKIDFSGTTPDAVLADLYRGAISLIFPSFYEGFGLPIIEAMACGTPVITSNIASMTEVAGQGNALLVNPSDIDELATAIDSIVENRQLHSTFSQRGLERSRSFTWEQVESRVKCALELNT